MKEKYEHEIRELENSEAGLKDKYIDTRTRLAESDANNQNLKAVVTQLELQLTHTTKVCASPRWAVRRVLMDFVVFIITFEHLRAKAPICITVFTFEIVFLLFFFPVHVNKTFLNSS